MLTFDLPVDEFVWLDLYDVTGAHLSTLYAGMMEAGTDRSVRLNASQYASGVYFYRFRTPHASRS